MGTQKYDVMINNLIVYLQPAETHQAETDCAAQLKTIQ